MKTIILILLCSISVSLSAQDKKAWNDKMHKYAPMMMRGIGVTFQEFEGLNSRIAEFPEYKQTRNHMWTISAGSMHVMKNFISQLSVTGGSSLTGDPDERSSTMRTLSGGFDLGYDLIPADMIMLYPMVGIGGECYTAVFYKDVNAVDFDDVACSPGVQNSIRSVKFKNSFVTYRFGLGLAFKSLKHPGTIGIQGGYTGAFKERTWRSAENQFLNGAPSDDINRWSVSLVLTGGGIMMKK
ncbi:MAG TPA: hypothetical protein VK484_07815 [Ferruginibacter sp.]|nr:hypothetical protein [Ferruginibacter sp.]